jgi:AraC-like DNA-binding protein
MAEPNCCPGELIFAARHAVFRGTLGEVAAHAHAAAQWLATAAGQTLEVVDARGQMHRGEGVAIGPRVVHAVARDNPRAITIWSDPAHAGAGEPRSPIQVFTPTPSLRALIDAALAAAPGEAYLAAARALAEAVTGAFDGARDDLVLRAIARFDDEPTHAHELDALARELGLSRSALARRFVRATGMNPRAYRLWSRLKRGLRHVASGHNLTAAAHAAGFADAAHFTRTFRQHFGLNPREAVPLLVGARETDR